MKKKYQSKWEKFKWIRIYRDDIDFLYKVLKDISSEVNLEIDEYTLDSPEEIPQIGREKAKRLLLKISEPYQISIEIDAKEAKVYASTTNTQTEGIFAIAKNTILERQRRYLKFVDDVRPIAFLMLILLIIISALPNKIDEVPTANILLASSFILLVAVILLPDVSKKIILELAYRRDSAPFIKRNRDEIIINIFFLALGWALGYFVR